MMAYVNERDAHYRRRLATCYVDGLEFLYSS